MKKALSVFALVLGILCRLTGILLSIAAYQILNEGDKYASLASLAIAIVFMFLPDLIKKRLKNSE